MPLFLITGAPGSGKSTILRELKLRGFFAYGTDEHGFSQWVNRQTGKVMIPPEDYDLHSFFEDNEWELNQAAIAKAHDEANTPNKNVFIAGVAAGIDEAWENFDKVIVLDVDADTLRQRITDRKDNNFGKVPKELKIVLEWPERHVTVYQKRGAIIVDGTPPTTIVVDNILAKTIS